MSASALRGSRVVVTGSAGFVGGHLVARLAGAGATVVGLDRRDPGPHSLGTHRRVDLTVGSDRAAVRDALREADVVFHLAGRPGVRGAGHDIERARYADNVIATGVVCELTPAATPLVVTSSSSVYGGARRVDGLLRPSHELDPLRPLGGYARSKVLAEEVCARRRAGGGVVTVVRPFTVTGPGQRPDMAVQRWLRASREGTPARLLGSAARLRDVTDVRDVARALVALTEHPGLDVVNVGTGRPVPLADLLGAVAAATGRPLVLDPAPAPPEDPDATCADVERLRALLGWVPVTDVRALVADQAGRPDGARDLHSRVASANMAWHSSASSANHQR